MAARSIFAIFASATLIIVNGGRLNLNKRSSHDKESRSLTACGTKGATKASIDREADMSIVNGRPATECEWRWQVGLRNNATQGPWCGGQLIAPDWVLTAAHCVSSPTFEVVAGEYRPGEASGNEQSSHAVQVFRHPQYSSRSFDWDMALVRLERPMEFNECVGTVCLPTEGNDVPAGTKCWITGWGTLASGGATPEVLQEAEVEILSQQACRDSDYGSTEILDSMICAQGRLANGSVVDACQGDSGGPLVCESGGQWTVYGATSWGRGCAGENHPGVWARVHEGTGWIEETMAANDGPAPTRARCPDFARNPFPDLDGDCQCGVGKFCSASNGAGRDCPTSGAIGGYGGTYFQPDCEECQCYSYTAAQALPEVGESKKEHSPACDGKVDQWPDCAVRIGNFQLAGQDYCAVMNDCQHTCCLNAPAPSPPAPPPFEEPTSPPTTAAVTPPPAPVPVPPPAHGGSFEPVVFEHVKRCTGPPMSSFWTADVCGSGPNFSSAKCDPGSEVGAGAAGLQPNGDHTMGPLFRDEGELWHLHVDTNNVSVFTCPEGNGITLDKYRQDAELERVRTSGRYSVERGGVLTGSLRTAFWQSSSPMFDLKATTEINLNFAQEHCSESWSSFWMYGASGTGRANEHRPFRWVSHYEIDIMENYPMSHPDWPTTWSHNFNYCNGLGNKIPGLCEEKLLGAASIDGFVPPSKEPGLDFFERHVTMWIGEKDCPTWWGPGDMERYGCVRGKTCNDPEHDMTGKKCPTVFITTCPVTGEPNQVCEKDESIASYHVYDVMPGDAINPFYNPGTGEPDPVHFRFVLDSWTPSAWSPLAAQCVLTVNDLKITEN